MSIVGVEGLHRPRTPSPRAGDLLIAAPSLLDPNFRRTVIYLLQHDDTDGSAGVVLNRPFLGLVDPAALPHWLTQTAALSQGGPVATDSVIALADVAVTPAHLRRAVGPGVCVVDLERVAEVDPFHPVRLFVGHSGWSAGQLDDELGNADWHVVTGSPDDVLLTDPSQVWQRVLSRQRLPIRMWTTLPDVVGAN